jgi:hypothetical protein
VLADRGGAPLHFVLAHVALSLHGSAESLRWLSVLAALGTVVVTYDLGRRLGGQLAGVTASMLAGTSSLLSIYGTFGRMYALLALAGGLAADLFVRALELPTPGSVTLAAAAAWLLPALHPYGGIVAASEALIALVLWRGSPLRPALPAIAIAVSTLPFVWADTRLGDRYDVGGGGRRLASPGHVWHTFADALSGFTGGTGLVVVLPVVPALAVLGLALTARRSPPFAALGVSTLLAVPIVLSILPVGRATGARQVSPRHLLVALPIWAALAGVGLAWLLARRPALVVAAVLAVVAVVAVAFPSTAISDPRDDSSLLSVGSRESLAAPARRLRSSVRERDLLFPYSAVFLAALPESGHAISLPRSQPETLLKALRRAPRPYGCLYVAVPGRWLVVRSCRDFRTPAAVLRELGRVLRSLESRASAPRVRLFLRFSRRRVVDPALRSATRPAR